MGKNKSNKIKWAKNHVKLAKCKLQESCIFIDNLVLQDGFGSVAFSVADISEIYLAYMKTLGGKAMHTCWVIKLKDGTEYIFSPEARKDKSQEGRHVRLFEALFGGYMVVYAVYTKESFLKYRGEILKSDFSLRRDAFGKMLSAICSGVNTTNENHKKYNLFFNNCAMYVTKDMQRAGFLNAPYFIKEYLKTDSLDLYFKKHLRDV